MTEEDRVSFWLGKENRILLLAFDILVSSDEKIPKNSYDKTYNKRSIILRHLIEAYVVKHSDLLPQETKELLSGYFQRRNSRLMVKDRSDCIKV